MDIETIENMWSEDSVINELDLTESSKKAAMLHSKYFKIYNRASRVLRNLEAEKARLILIKNDYYQGNLDQTTMRENGWSPFKRTVLKADLPMWLNADRDLIEINQKIQEMQQVTTFLESIIRSINNRHYHIRNILEYEKFINGGR